MSEMKEELQEKECEKEFHFSCFSSELILDLLLSGLVSPPAMSSGFQWVFSGIYYIYFLRHYTYIFLNTLFINIRKYLYIFIYCLFMFSFTFIIIVGKAWHDETRLLKTLACLLIGVRWRDIALLRQRHYVCLF